jgi:putative oxidoreductase
MTASYTANAAPSGLAGVLLRINRLFAHIPHWLVALVGRFSIAAVFWKSGQTKVQGFQIDPIGGIYELGLPRFADSTIDLFKDEYNLPLVSPEVAALFAASAEHIFPVLILMGLATRLSALALLIMTAVIQTLVYPGAYPTHGTWAAILLMLMWRGAGVVSLDHLIARWRGA